MHAHHPLLQRDGPTSKRLHGDARPGWSAWGPLSLDRRDPCCSAGCSGESGRWTFPLLAQPVASEGEFLCSPPSSHPQPPGTPLLRWRLDSRHHHALAPRVPPGQTLSCCARAAQTQPVRRPSPSTWPPGPRQAAGPGPIGGSAGGEGAAGGRERAVAAGGRLQAPRETQGFGEAAVALGSGSLHRLQKNQKQNQHSAPASPHLRSARLRRARPATAGLASRARDGRPRASGARAGPAGDLIRPAPRPARTALGLGAGLGDSGRGPRGALGVLWRRLAARSLLPLEPQLQLGENLRPRAGCHLVKATGKGCFMGREKGQEVMLPSLAAPGPRTPMEGAPLGRRTACGGGGGGGKG